jgi:calcineurin-like phosphoesterase
MILPKGTGYITDAGLTGPRGSVIGIKTELVIKKYLLQTPVRFEPSEEDLWLNAVFMEIDDLTGRCLSIERIQRRLETSEENT